MIFATSTLRALVVVAATACFASAAELRGGQRSLGGGGCTENCGTSPQPTQCQRDRDLLYFTPSVPIGTKIQAREVGNNSNSRTFVAVEDNRTWVRLTDEDVEWANVFHTSLGGTMRVRFQFPDGKWGKYKWCLLNVTPIGLDIDGSGAVEKASGDFMFDITGDGNIEHLHEWFAPTEGILVDAALAMQDGLISTQHFVSSSSVTDALDLAKHSGAITGKHLFGDMGSLFADGYEKLQLKDSDHNGYVSGSELGGMAVWVDANSNAKVDAGELGSLLSYGVVGLRITPDKGTYVSEAQLADGSTMMIEDLFFS